MNSNSSSTYDNSGSKDYFTTKYPIPLNMPIVLPIISLANIHLGILSKKIKSFLQMILCWFVKPLKGEIKKIIFDRPYNTNLFSVDIDILVELVECTCFSNKISLQLVVTGWSICNNVQIIIFT